VYLPNEIITKQELHKLYKYKLRFYNKVSFQTMWEVLLAAVHIQQYNEDVKGERLYLASPRLSKITGHTPRTCRLALKNLQMLEVLDFDEEYIIGEQCRELLNNSLYNKLQQASIDYIQKRFEQNKELYNDSYMKKAAQLITRMLGKKVKGLKIKQVIGRLAYGFSKFYKPEFGEKILVYIKEELTLIFKDRYKFIDYLTDFIYCLIERLL